MDVSKYEKNGKTAVLYSPGYGAGWSTWGEKELAYDRRVVEFWLEHKDDKEFMNNISRTFDSDESRATEDIFQKWGYDHVYFGGFKNIVLEWVEKGVPFKINEYDGWESIEFCDDVDWTVF